MSFPRRVDHDDEPHPAPLTSRQQLLPAGLDYDVHNFVKLHGSLHVALPTPSQHLVTMYALGSKPSGKPSPAQKLKKIWTGATTPGSGGGLALPPPSNSSIPTTHDDSAAATATIESTTVVVENVASSAPPSGSSSIPMPAPAVTTSTTSVMVGDSSADPNTSCSDGYATPCDQSSASASDKRRHHRQTRTSSHNNSNTRQRPPGLDHHQPPPFPPPSSPGDNDEGLLGLGYQDFVVSDEELFFEDFADDECDEAPFQSRSSSQHKPNKQSQHDPPPPRPHEFFDEDGYADDESERQRVSSSRSLKLLKKAVRAGSNRSFKLSAEELTPPLPNQVDATMTSQNLPLLQLATDEPASPVSPNPVTSPNSALLRGRERFKRMVVSELTHFNAESKQQQQQHKAAPHHPRSRAESLPGPLPLLRYIRSWGGAATSGSRADPNNAGGAIPDIPLSKSDITGESHQRSFLDDDDDDAVSDVEEGPAGPMEDVEEDDFSVDDDSWTSSEVDEPLDWLDGVEWSEMPPLPHRFCLSASRTTGLPYLDTSMLQGGLLERESNRFAVEQGLFLQAVMQLLAERDQVGVEGSIHSGDNIWKKGPLKKLSFIGGSRYKRPGTTKWKVKYVELRLGNLCYYEDSGHGRKTIHIRQADTTVQESPPNRGHPDFVFELCVQGSPTRYWMASSEEERQSWIRAIQSAMVGDEAPRRELDLTPHQEALELIRNMRERMEMVDSKESYLEAVHLGMPDEDVLRVPVAYVRQQIEKEQEQEERQKPAKPPFNAQKQLKYSIADFWKNMSQATFAINGITVPCDSPLASARVVGALTRSILEYDKSFAGGVSTAECNTAGLMTELQAVSYARNILLAILRSKEQQQAKAVAQYLLGNPHSRIVAFKGNDDYVINLEVSFAGDELPDDFLLPISDEMTGWLWIRRPKQPLKAGRKRFAVLTGAVLSYYEAANPRPIGLRGQLILNGANLKARPGDADTDGKFELIVVTAQDQDRILSFENESDYLEWKEALQLAIDSCSIERLNVAATAIPEGDELGERLGAVAEPGAADAPSQQPNESSRSRTAGNSIRRSAERVAQGVTERVIKVSDGSIRGGIRVIKGAKDGGIKVIKTATDGSMKVLRGAVGRLRPSRSNSSDFDRRRGLTRRPSMQVLLNNTALSGKRDEPTVQCVFQSTHNFYVCPLESEDDDNFPEEDRWLTVSAKLYQAFLLMGGPSGRMARGDALIELDLVEGAQEIFEF